MIHRTSRAPSASHVLALGLLALVAGCKKLEEGAREAYSQEQSCPADRVTVVARPDVDLYTKAFGTPTVPPDVAADPGRRKVWETNQQTSRAAYRQRNSAFEAAGCGKTVLYSCFHPNAPRGGENLAAVACTHVD
jgi:hypothetical protein